MHIISFVTRFSNSVDYSIDCCWTVTEHWIQLVHLNTWSLLGKRYKITETVILVTNRRFCLIIAWISVNNKNQTLIVKDNLHSHAASLLTLLVSEFVAISQVPCFLCPVLKEVCNFSSRVLTYDPKSTRYFTLYDLIILK